jgi:hypothetical protein
VDNAAEVVDKKKQEDEEALQNSVNRFGTLSPFEEEETENEELQEEPVEETT